jgi:uncharacterized protein YbaR (Trm112 family)
MRVVVCPYCKTSLLALNELGSRRFAVEPTIESNQAREIAKRWLSSGINKDPKLRRGADVREAFLSFLPFYRVEADCVGFALGTEKRSRTVGTGKNRRRQTYEVDVERSVERSLDRTYPAVNVAEWGIRRIRLEGDPIVAYEPSALDRQGMVFPPTGSEPEILGAALESFKQQSDPSSGLSRRRFRFLQTLRERLTVVYYPLWVVRYRYRGRSYQILVDGEDATLAYGKAAGNDLYRALMFVSTLGLASFVATTALQLGGGGLGFIGAAIGAALFYWGWRKFRWGGVVIEGTGAKGPMDLADSLGKAVRQPGQTLLGAGFDVLRRR